MALKQVEDDVVHNAVRLFVKIIGMHGVDDFHQRFLINKNGANVGKVTSAVYSPRLEKNIALAMVSVDSAVIGSEVEVITPSGPTRATVVERPFYDPKKSLAAA